jgi:hypothetical protein
VFGLLVIWKCVCVFGLFVTWKCAYVFGLFVIWMLPTYQKRYLWVIWEFITNVMGTFFGMSESGEASKKVSVGYMGVYY